jgi:hypothetical protein
VAAGPFRTATNAGSGLTIENRRGPAAQGVGRLRLTTCQASQIAEEARPRSTELWFDRTSAVDMTWEFRDLTTPLLVRLQPIRAGWVAATKLPVVA